MRITFLTILGLLLFQSVIYAQSTAELLKVKTIEGCDCFTQIDYIDNKADFEIKFEDCTALTKKEAAQIEKKGSVDEFKKQLQAALSDNCPAFASKLYSLRNSYSIGIPDSIYNAEPKCKSVEEEIIGQYSLSFGNHSPEGGARLYVLPDYKYMIVAFGELQVGSWKILKEKYLHFIPKKMEYPFHVYGRFNPAIGDSTITSFLGDDFSYRTLIHYGLVKDSQPNLIPIFNEEANCFDFPYLGSIAGKYDEIALAYQKRYEYDENEPIDIYSFKNVNKFNDFVVLEYTDMEVLRTERVNIQGDQLIFGLNKVTKRYPLPEVNSEDALFINEYTKRQVVLPELYYNAMYRSFDKNQVNSELYEFDEKLNSFIYINGEGIEFSESEEYTNYLVVNKYELLDNVSKQTKRYSIAEASIIYTVCE
ncbi:hypothetical protein [Crocinitomix catalasitica]|uniref:hypothetical protein n=1 Tax=Crocinitomix catalasitica TaxID=184607 RepID=UPI000489A1E3|nr:hypothetical protein [Crocinitomix catalasitica]